MPRSATCASYPAGILCGCGNHGCFEQYASGTALVRERARARPTPVRCWRGPCSSAPAAASTGSTGPIITDAAREGDPFAIEQLAELGSWLGEGIASLAAVLDPAVVAIGGGVADADELLLDPIRAAFESNLPGRGHRPMLEIRKATLGNEAGLIGAADLARR